MAASRRRHYVPPLSTARVSYHVDEARLTISIFIYDPS